MVERSRQSKYIDNPVLDGSRFIAGERGSGAPPEVLIEYLASPLNRTLLRFDVDSDLEVPAADSFASFVIGKLPSVYIQFFGSKLALDVQVETDTGGFSSNTGVGFAVGSQPASSPALSGPDEQNIVAASITTPGGNSFKAGPVPGLAELFSPADNAVLYLNILANPLLIGDGIVQIKKGSIIEILFLEIANLEGLAP